MGNDHLLTPRLQQAVELTVTLHGKDARKGSNIPYLAHLFQVCALVQHYGGDEDQAIAALLHDALEDKANQITKDEITRIFGERVCRMVLATTDTGANWDGTGAKAPWRQRKEAYIEHVKKATEPADLLVSLADKVYNLDAILRDHSQKGEVFFDLFNADKKQIFWYYESLAHAYRIANVDSPLLDELDGLVDRFRRIN